MARGRHQKKDVEAALKRAERAGLKVMKRQNGHDWGVVVCCPCNDRVLVHGTPGNQGNEANKIDRFTERHRSCA